MAVTLVNTKWGQVVVQVNQPATDNPDCNISEHPCSMMAYLAMTGKNKTFAAVHNHGKDGMWVVNLTVRNAEGTEFKLTGPYTSLTQAVHDAASIYGIEAERARDEVKHQKATGQIHPAVAVGANVTVDEQLDKRRSTDAKDWEGSKSALVPWEQQLVEITGWKLM